MLTRLHKGATSRSLCCYQSRGFATTRLHTSSGVTRTITAGLIPRPSTKFNAFHLQLRSYASENTSVDPKIVNLIYKMQTTPAVMDAIHNFEELVRKKGFSSQTGFGQFFSFMKDKEIEEALQRSKYDHKFWHRAVKTNITFIVMIEMDNAGITISPEM